MSEPRELASLPGRRVAAASLILALVLTAIAFAAAQRLKRATPLVYGTQAIELFSPTLVRGQKSARFLFRLHRSDDITITIVTPQGDPVRTLDRDLAVTAGRQIRRDWDGAADSGRLAPDGAYRVQLTLRRAGRAVVLPDVLLTKDTTPPNPKVRSIGPERDPGTPRPELLPRADGKPIRARYRVIGRSPGIAVIRTDLARPRVVLDTKLKEQGNGTWEWDGTVKGRPVPAGTYVIAAHAKDLVGNQGWSTGTAEQIAPLGGSLRGRGGVVVRYLAAQSPERAVRAGRRAGVGVIAAGARYRWSLRRIGESRPRSRGTSRQSFLRPRVPKGPSGLHVLELRTAEHRAQSAILTQGAARQRVLIVVPQASIIGAAQVDDNGDGAPDTLDRGVSVETARVPVDPLLSADLTERVAPLLRALDRRGRRYDLTTDLALARGQGAPLRGHSGVILAGTTRYLDRRLQTQLVAWVRRGGRLWVAEPGSLLRSITTTPTQATRPTQPARLDPFGFELGEPLRVRGVSLLSDPLKLWRGTDGRLDGPFDVEPIVRLPSGAVRRAVATTPDGRQVVYAAAGLGRGLVIRSGVPELGARALRDADARELLRRLWATLQGADR